jgi:hypothetical protein
MCHLPEPRHAEGSQIDRRALAGKEPDAVAEQDRNQDDDDLVDQDALDALPGDIGPDDEHVLAPGGVGRNRHRLTDVAIEEGDRFVILVGRRAVRQDELRPYPT